MYLQGHYPDAKPYAALLRSRRIEPWHGENVVSQSAPVEMARRNLVGRDPQPPIHNNINPDAKGNKGYQGLSKGELEQHRLANESRIQALLAYEKKLKELIAITAGTGGMTGDYAHELERTQAELTALYNNNTDLSKAYNNGTSGSVTTTVKPQTKPPPPPPPVDPNANKSNEANKDKSKQGQDKPGETPKPGETGGPAGPGSKASGNEDAGGGTTPETKVPILPLALGAAGLCGVVYGLYAKNTIITAVGGGGIAFALVSLVSSSTDNTTAKTPPKG